jgi:tetratricopeptide (TPR) repeat protein
MTAFAAPGSEDRPRLPVQLQMFTRAVEAYPDAPVNYLLRGEEWLAIGRLDDARADFVAARALAEKQATDSAWGYVFQAYVDRADAGLRQCVSILD